MPHPKMQWSCISLFCWAFLGWTSCSYARKVVVEYNVCENITIPMCMNLPYNCTKMPNRFDHRTQQQAALDMVRFNPLVITNCYSHLRLFLCSVYIPRYTMDPAGSPPCRSFCQAARAGCGTLLMDYGYRWPSALNCSQFPETGDSPCLNENGRVVSTTATKPPTPVCEPMKIAMCKTGSHNQTSVPNHLGHTSQEDAIRHMQQFQPLLTNSSCSATLKTFLCSAYQPRCYSGGSTTSAPPCRSLCRKAEQSCQPYMKQGASWPIKCGQFPKPSQGVCTNDGACEPITVEMCRGIGYHLTRMPNLLGHRRQSDAAMGQFSFVTKMNCSPYAKLLMCSYLTPKCDKGIIRRPCRSLCNQVKSGCQGLLKIFTGLDWPLNCSSLPERTAEACVDADQGNKARSTDTVRSAVFPVTLKCQLPGKYFTIQRISIVDGNGRKRKLRNKGRNALKQCNATHSRVHDGFECTLSDPVKLGISADTVIASVSVTYKCWKK